MGKPIHPLLSRVMSNKSKLEAAHRKMEVALERAPCGTGYLTIIAQDSITGEIRQIEQGKNIVVNYGRSALAHLIAGDSADSYKIVSMRFGDTGGAPAVTDTNLFGTQIIEKAVVYDFPDGSSGLKVRFTATVGAGEGNGSGTQIYQEACLVMNNGQIFSHKVTGSISKDNTIVITALWTYLF